MTIAPGTKLGRYEVRSKLGEGGMGEVYLAEDAQLRRQVALKVLSPDLAAKQERMRRFIQEAQSAAALNHPNIAHIYEISESEGTNFIAMEFVDGKTLREKIYSEKSELKVLLKHLLQVADGLAKAHASGIVHRDLKPDNIMITRDGHAKILDFGLAKLLEARPESADDTGEAATAMMPMQLSTPGVVMGTVGYMSPEQASAKPVDQRSDIFSFGCLIYEAATGSKPFTGDSVVDTLHKIIHDPAPPITDFNPSAPTELQRVIRKCLAKEPAKRYQTIRDTANDLEELLEEMKGVSNVERSVALSMNATTSGTTGPATTDAASENQTEVYAGVTKSGQSAATGTVTNSSSSLEYAVTQARSHKLATAIIVVFLVGVISAVGYFAFVSRGGGTNQISSIAVLPFENKSGNADSDYLSDGVAESLIYKLSQLPNLRVSPRSSVFRYKGKEIDIEKVGAELGVDAVMSGRMVQRGDNLTISVDLVDVRNKKTLWGEQYERQMSDLLATQKEIATTITEKLQLKLSGESAQKLAKKYTDNNEAYEVFLRGQFHYAKRTKDELLQSIEFYQQAIKLDPNFALAYVGMARSYNVMPSFAFMSPKEAMPRAKAAAERALQIDPNLAEAHGALANALALFDWDWSAAEREFKRATELDPNVAEIHNRYGRSYLMPLGRFDEATAELKRALELEPISAAIGANLIVVYLRARKNDLALEHAKNMSALEPNHPAIRSWLSWAYNANGLYSETIALNEKILQIDASDQDALGAIGFAYAKAGRRRDAEGVLNKLNDIPKSQYVSHYGVAGIYVALGEHEKAIAELEKAFDDRDRLCVEVRYDFQMDPVREDPLFRSLLKRLNLPE